MAMKIAIPDLISNSYFPACAAVGAIFMVLADIASRVIVAQQTIPIGVVTALVGVPFFAIILYRSRPQT